MTHDAAIRPGEVVVDLPEKPDAAVYFIGRISTPWKERSHCPRGGDLIDGPLCRIAVFERWIPALAGVEKHPFLQVLYWMNVARRDLVSQRPRGADSIMGTFSVRSPVRPNPIAVSPVALVKVQGSDLIVRGLDCLDGTPLIDIKPNRCPVAAP